ncbi:MAG TPA: Hsp20/alpha crystallin family protein [Spirochaetota bacterium]|nr:Hsp20/alpha crystallin family protein [Spirochaetota bacterium]
MDLTKKNEQENANVESTRGYYYYVPSTDIYETSEEYKLIFDLPGIEKEDINVKVEKDILTVTAESKKNAPDCYECLRNEIDFYGYQRSFNLNKAVDNGKIGADFSDGVLTLSMPKKEEQKTKEIQIKVA